MELQNYYYYIYYYNNLLLRKKNKIHEIHPGIAIPESDWQQLLKTHFGEGGDSKFVKTLLLKSFTKEELKNGNVSGRNAPKLIKQCKLSGADIPTPPLQLDIVKLQSSKSEFKLDVWVQSMYKKCFFCNS